MDATEHFDVVLVGAGISGLGFGHHLREQCPSKRFVILEAMETFGGTWTTHQYPGIRSDSDLYTFGYRFKPWTGDPIAEGHLILNYLGEVIEESNLAENIRYRHKIVAAKWSSQRQVWTLDVERPGSGSRLRITCNFFVWTGGYYEHSRGYTPDWPGFSDYRGEVIHPQTWPEDVDLAGKNVIVIGSGATAATLIPNIAGECRHLTMLQRSPTYFWTSENRNELADRLRPLDIPESWIHEIVRRDLLKTQRETQQVAALYPEETRQGLLAELEKLIGPEMLREHFTPSYRPWQQRLAFAPDADLFKAINRGDVSVVTDHIERFTQTGIELRSGRALDADVVITATGFNMLFSGNIAWEVDGKRVRLSDTFTYRGLMLSEVPNYMLMFGYFRTSWTMRVDLVADYFCRLLKHIDAIGASSVRPRLRPQDGGMQSHPWISEEEFNPGYIRRNVERLPRSGDREPWNFSPDYYVEREQMPHYALDEDALVYEMRSPASGSR
ncbi:MAG: NAD(P)/FAD-dependent oxidoreductase [Gammaproteobacteria bacterium AqS3]|nr:NAD(P)/FAD-dependent oxidoreductase [Gammaproteobacteria bacterium AqS3]